MQDLELLAAWRIVVVYGFKPQMNFYCYRNLNFRKIWPHSMQTHRNSFWLHPWLAVSFKWICVVLWRWICRYLVVSEKSSCWDSVHHSWDLRRAPCFRSEPSSSDHASQRPKTAERRPTLSVIDCCRLSQRVRVLRDGLLLLNHFGCCVDSTSRGSRWARVLLVSTPVVVWLRPIHYNTRNT